MYKVQVINNLYKTIVLKFHPLGWHEIDNKW